MFRFIVFVAFLATSTLSDNVVRQCVHNAGELPISFQVEGCSSAPCLIPQLEDAVFNIKFNATRDSEALKTQLIVSLLGTLTVPFDLGPASQTCSGLTNTSCPVKEGQELEYTLKLPIEAYIPIGTSVSIEISVLDDANSPAFCARVPLSITEPRNYKEMIQVVN